MDALSGKHTQLLDGEALQVSGSLVECHSDGEEMSTGVVQSYQQEDAISTGRNRRHRHLSLNAK